jgi:hypothetical protein
MEMAFVRFLRLWNFSNLIAKECRLFISNRLFLGERCRITGLLDILGRIFLILWKTGEDLLDFRVNLIDIFHSGIELLLRLILILAILCKFGRSNAWPAVEWTLHIVIIDDRLLHLPHLTENGLLLFAVAAAVGRIVILLVIGPSIFAVHSPWIHKVLGIQVISECAFLESVDGKGLLEVVASEWGDGPMLVNTLLSLLSCSRPGQQLAVLALFQAFNPFTAGWSIILFFYFLDSQIGLAGLQFWVPVEVREIVALAGGVGLLVGNVGEAVVFHS